MVSVYGGSDEGIAAEDGVQGCFDNRALPNLAKGAPQNLNARAAKLGKIHVRLVDAGWVVERSQELHDAEFVVHHFWRIAGVETILLVVRGAGRGGSGWWCSRGELTYSIPDIIFSNSSHHGAA